MKIFNLSSQVHSPCFIVKHAGVTLMLDCHLDTSSLHRFLPVSIMEDFSKRCKISNEQRKMIEDKEFIDSTPSFIVPETDQVDMASIDVILLTTHHSLLALPYITEYTAFHGSIFATEPALTFGKLLMEELVTNVTKVKKDKISSSSPPIKNDFDKLMEGDLSGWKGCYNHFDVVSCVSKVTSVTFNEVKEIPCALKIKALSSGFSIGSCNWVVYSDYHKISYIGASTVVSIHTMPMGKSELRSSDVLLMSCLIQNPLNNYDNYMKEFCMNTSMTLKKKGRVLVPCSMVGGVFDLIDSLFQHLDSASLLSTPVYIISPIAKNSLAFSNIYSEWLSTHKQAKVYQPESPFAHAELINTNRLEVFPSMSEGFSKAVKHPCVVFCSDQLLRYGDAVDFMLQWKDNPNNSAIFTDPTINFFEVLGPYFPMKMKVFHCPIDTRLSIPQANKLIKELQPTHLILPQPYVNPLNPELYIDPELNPLPLAHGLMQRVSLKRMFQKMTISSQLADALDIEKIKKDVGVSMVSGYFSAKDYKYVLKPFTKESTTRVEDSKGNTCIPVCKPHFTFKPPNASKLMKTLLAQGLEPVMEEKEAGHVIFMLEKNNVLIEIKNDTTNISFNNQNNNNNEITNNNNNNTNNRKIHKVIKEAVYASMKD